MESDILENLKNRLPNLKNSPFLSLYQAITVLLMWKHVEWTELSGKLSIKSRFKEFIFGV